MTLFVTGVGGYLGHAIAAATADVTGTVRSRPAPAGVRATTVDVRDERAVAEAISAARPDAVIHTAYLRDGDDAWSVNVDGTAAVARATRAAGLRLVHMSSDVVFTGDLGRPLREEDALAPIGVYGESKAAAEDAVMRAHPEAVMVRTSLIYGGHEPSPDEARTLDPTISFFDDELRCPVLAADLARAVVELAATDVSGPLHVAGADTVSRLEFAQLIAAKAGRDPDQLSGGPRPAGRAGDLGLDCSRAEAILGWTPRGVREVLRG